MKVEFEVIGDGGRIRRTFRSMTVIPRQGDWVTVDLGDEETQAGVVDLVSWGIGSGEDQRVVVRVQDPPPIPRLRL